MAILEEGDEDKQLVIPVEKLAGVEVLCVIPRIVTSNVHFKLEEMVVHRFNEIDSNP